MKTLGGLLLLGIFAIDSAWAQAPFDIQIHSGMGTQTGTLQWSIAGDASGKTGPNVLSELTYRNVSYSVFEASGEVRFNEGWLSDSTLFLEYRKGQANDGQAQDSDYNGNNRTQEYSRSTSSTNNSSMDALTIGVGYRFYLSDHTSLQPMAAFTQNHQTMLMTDGTQVVDTYNPTNIGAFRNPLDSRYATSWTGGWAGLQWHYETPTQRFGLSVKEYAMDYHAEANWNLRKDFAHPKSFEQWSYGNGTGIDLSYQYLVSENFSLWANWFKQSWKANPGRDRVYFADGTTSDSHLNGATWDSTGVSLGLLLRI